jgi:hypothetical protein
MKAIIKFVVGVCGLAILGFAIVSPDPIGKAIGSVLVLAIVFTLIQRFYNRGKPPSSEFPGRAFILAVLIVIITWWIFFR